MNDNWAVWLDRDRRFFDDLKGEGMWMRVHFFGTSLDSVSLDFRKFSFFGVYINGLEKLSHVWRSKKLVYATMHDFRVEANSLAFLCSLL
ncbi:hypothetical protein PRUPE_2G037900 [Prunus persica]|nr:hypothetical protein PRUPE_2G037900 [Prunus persica]